MVGEVSTAQLHSAIEVPIGIRLRSRRNELGLTLKDVAEGAGLTIGFISQVERGLAFPSLTSLSSICTVLDQHISTFFAQPSGTFPSTHHRKRPVYSLRGDLDEGEALRYERLSSIFDGSVLSSVIVHEPPGYREEPIRHEGEEIFFVLDGQITVEVDGKRTLLLAGDSIHFASTRLHSSWNHTDREASFLHVCTTDLFGDKGRPASSPGNRVGHETPEKKIPKGKARRK